jgi:DNA modification methylase
MEHRELAATDENALICGDCRVHLRRIATATVDLVVTDPPYGLNADTTITRRSGKFGKASDITSSFSWDKRPDLVWIAECLRVLRPGGTMIAFYEREHLHELIAEAKRHGGELRDVGAWHKTNPVPQVRKVKWASALELFVVITKPGQRHTFNWQHGYHHNVIVAPICTGGERTPHPTQKPLAVILPMVRYWSNPGDLVLDPFAGAGTSAVAARMLGRRYVAIEVDNAFCTMAAERLGKCESDTPASAELRSA